MIRAASESPFPVGIRPLEGDASLEATSVLLERLRTGDSAALDLLLARYLKPLARWASGRLPTWARDLRDTDDLVQDAVMGTLRQLNAFEAQKEGAFHAYLRQAVNNRIRDEIRRVRRRPQAVIADDDLEDRSPSPLEAAIGRDALERYERALARLPEADREAVIARVDLGLGYADIGAALGKPSPDAARMMVSRALLRLAQEMDRA
jgi:RNA polymerase sigma-70 factor (ECF subfamily)